MSQPQTVTINGETLPVDRDGDPYRVDEYIGPWKVTHCCGAFLKGFEDGVYCRQCAGDGGLAYDGPARLEDRT